MSLESCRKEKLGMSFAEMSRFIEEKFGERLPPSTIRGHEIGRFMPRPKAMRIYLELFGGFLNYEDFRLKHEEYKKKQEEKESARSTKQQS